MKVQEWIKEEKTVATLEVISAITGGSASCSIKKMGNDYYFFPGDFENKGIAHKIKRASVAAAKRRFKEVA